MQKTPQENHEVKNEGCRNGTGHHNFHEKDKEQQYIHREIKARRQHNTGIRPVTKRPADRMR